MCIPRPATRTPGCLGDVRQAGDDPAVTADVEPGGARPGSAQLVGELGESQLDGVAVCEYASAAWA